MKILEFGNKENKKLILIHGFQCPYQIWNKYISHFKKDFHIIVPVMSGHDIETKSDFVSFSEDAREIEDFVIQNYGNKVFAVYGISMGGVLTAHLWQNQRIEFENIIFDGSPLVSTNALFKIMSLSFYLDVTHKTQKRDKKTVERAVGTIISKENLGDFLAVLDNITDETIVRCVNEVFDYKLPKNIPVRDTKIHFFHGTKLNEFYAKKSARFVKNHYKNVNIKCFNGKGHCENALLNPDIMLAELDKILL